MLQGQADEPPGFLHPRARASGARSVSTGSSSGFLRRASAQVTRTGSARQRDVYIYINMRNRNQFAQAVAYILYTYKAYLVLWLAPSPSCAKKEGATSRPPFLRLAVLQFGGHCLRHVLLLLRRQGLLGAQAPSAPAPLRPFLFPPSLQAACLRSSSPCLPRRYSFCRPPALVKLFTFITGPRNEAALAKA